MGNVFFELDRLKFTLENRGLDPDAVDAIVRKASDEINAALQKYGEQAMQSAIESGVEKRSPEFINELRLNHISMELTTSSGNMDFSDPPFPMLPRLLVSNAKPMKDGSGVYKVIPVGESSRNRPKVSTSIYDTWKQINAERVEAARAQRDRIIPKDSKGKFRTATSKQNTATQWVQPARDKNFTEQMQNINQELRTSMDDVIRNIIREYEEGF